MAIDQDMELFLYASQKGDIDTVKELLNKNINLINQRQTGFTALIGASWQGQSEVVKYLISKGANVNLPTTYNLYTALQRAILNGKVECAIILIQNGADVNIRHKYGDSAFEIAKKRRTKQEQDILHVCIIIFQYLLL
jgi:ankyrin repeat protein